MNARIIERIINDMKKSNVLTGLCIDTTGNATVIDTENGTQEIMTDEQTGDTVLVLGTDEGTSFIDTRNIVRISF